MNGNDGCNFCNRLQNGRKNTAIEQIFAA